MKAKEQIKELEKKIGILTQDFHILKQENIKLKNRLNLGKAILDVGFV